MHRSARRATSLLAFAFLAACGQNDATVAHAPAVSSNSGGSGNGKPSIDGGTVSAGGTTSAGGTASAGGATNSGGISNTGGTANTAGTANTGGATNSGGMSSTGGAIGSGGAIGTGGISSAGGAPNTGGATNTGGAANTGGSVGAGGGSSSAAVGAHLMTYYSIGDGTAPLVTPPMTVQVSGSTILVGLGRGNQSLFNTAPTDNQSNTAYTSLGEHPYPLSTDSGTAVYAFPSAKGGTGFRVSAPNGPSLGGNTDEMTLFVIEVTNGSRVVDTAWMDTAAVNPTTSVSVTTTAAATLVAFWWGDSTSVNGIASNDGFTVLDEQLLATDQVQGASAFKNVASAGTYGVTWTASPAQPAQLWLVAVQ